MTGMKLPETVFAAAILDDEECRYFVDAFKACESRVRDDPDNPFWDKRILDAQDTTPSIREQLEFVAGTVGLAIEQHFKVRPLYTDSVHMVRWEAGQGMPAHLDAVPEMPWREFGSIVYLNADYEGGQTFLEEFGVEIQPVAGLLVAFPGDWKHRHGVRPVRKGTRYTLPNFWTSDATKAWKKLP